MAVLVNSSLGEFTIDLHVEEVPLLAANFLKLCKIKYYNNSAFHSIEKNFIAKTGLPFTGDSLNSEKFVARPGEDLSILSLLLRQNYSCYKKLLNDDSSTLYRRELFHVETGLIKEQFHDKLQFNKLAVVSMSNETTGNIGSSFFITLREDLEYLNKKRSIIGYVSENASEIVKKLNEVLVESVECSSPLVPTFILETHVIFDPFEDFEGFETLIPQKVPVALQPKLFEKPGDTVEGEIEALEKLARSEAKSRAVALEILGDMPDAELAPPRNVLFLCKLNPVTESQDLEMIFSRFGKILSCSIIRDWKTGDSLQYGFIEFADHKACEDALFKMEGCLIDDRRIHVDFCQSVSKRWVAYKRYGVFQKRDNDSFTGTSFAERIRETESFVFKSSPHRSRTANVKFPYSREPHNASRSPRERSPRHGSPRHGSPRHGSPRERRPRHGSPRERRPRHCRPHHGSRTHGNGHGRRSSPQAHSGREIISVSRKR